MKRLTTPAAILLATLLSGRGRADEPAPWKDLFNGKDLTGWVNVNTKPETWKVQDGMIICTGHPIGVMRTEKQYENYVLHVEWMHMEPGGNSGVFIHSDGTAVEGKPFPKGMEVQILELQWPILNPDKDGKPRTDAYVHGELFGVNGLKIVPDNPRGERSM